MTMGGCPGPGCNYLVRSSFLNRTINPCRCGLTDECIYSPFPRCKLRAFFLPTTNSKENDELKAVCSQISTVIRESSSCHSCKVSL